MLLALPGELSLTPLEIKKRVRVRVRVGVRVKVRVRVRVRLGLELFFRVFSSGRFFLK